MLFNAIFATLVGFGTLIALAVFFWRRSGFGSGRRFGNRIAAHLGLPRDLFHAVLDHGVQGDSSRELLAALEALQLDPDRAGLRLAPTLARGVERLEAHFGPQERLDRAKPVVARLVARAQAQDGRQRPAR